MRKLNPVMVTSAASVLVLVSVESPASEAIGQFMKIDGTAMIAQDARFKPGSEGGFLKEGDRIFALEGSEAVLLFKDACQYRLGDDQVLDLGPQSPCALGLGGEYRPGLLAAVTQSADAIEQDPVLSQARAQLGSVDDEGAYIDLTDGATTGTTGETTGGSIGGTPGTTGGTTVGTTSGTIGGTTGTIGGTTVGTAGGTIGGTTGIIGGTTGVTGGLLGGALTTTTLATAGLGIAALGGLVTTLSTQSSDSPNPPLSD